MQEQMRPSFISGDWIAYDGTLDHVPVTELIHRICIEWHRAANARSRHFVFDDSAARFDPYRSAGAERRRLMRCNLMRYILVEVQLSRPRFKSSQTVHSVTMPRRRLHIEPVPAAVPHSTPT